MNPEPNMSGGPAWLLALALPAGLAGLTLCMVAMARPMPIEDRWPVLVLGLVLALLGIAPMLRTLRLHEPSEDDEEAG